jgi:hypothetical protein
MCYNYFSKGDKNGMHVMVDSLMENTTILLLNQISMLAALVVPL